MAKSNNDEMQNLRAIIADIRKGDCKPVYILHGEEPYYIDLIVEHLEKCAIPAEDRDFNCDIFYGSGADIDYVIGAAKQLPVMADRKLVFLKEAQGITGGKTSLERFARYVANPNPSTIFVLTYKGEAFKATSELIKATKKSGGVVFQSETPPDWLFANVVRTYCAEHRISIEEKALNMMVDFIGAPLSKFYGELNKLVAVKGEGNRITVEDVERNIGVSKDFNNFELVNALSTKNYPNAMRIIKYFQNAPKDNGKNRHSQGTALTLYNYFSNLVIAHYLADKSEDSLKRELGLKARVQVEAIRNGLRNYSATKAVNAIHHIREYDTRAKGIGSAFKEGDLLGELLFKLFT